MPATVVIIEDQRMFRELLQSMLGDVVDLEIVALASTVAQGWTACEAHRPDLALIDLRLPDGSGLELGERLKLAFPEISLLAVTSLIDPVTTTQVFESGFHGYVEKDQSYEVLLEAVSTVAEGGLYFTQLVRENRKRIFNDADAVNKILSQREQLIIGHLCTKQTNKQIAALMGLSLRTVENHRYRIIKRLGLEGSQGLIEFGHRLGLNRLVEHERPRAD
jgi:two-component system nitrate/nitrite response regulator NarL